MYRSKKVNLSQEDLVDLWLKKYYGITLKEAFEKEPWEDSREFYDRYPCTQEQHDEWNKEAKALFKKALKLNQNSADRSWVFTYMLTAPIVLES